MESTMNENNNRSFFGDVLKFFIIFNIIDLICKGIFFIFKITFMLLTRFIQFIIYFIAKILPRLKTKLLEFYYYFNNSFKPCMTKKWKEFISTRKKQSLAKRDKILMLKKFKYLVIEKLYKYELQIFFVIIFIFIIILNILAVMYYKSQM